jgi:hypothetical protein
MSAPSGVLGNGRLRTACTAGSRTSELTARGAETRCFAGTRAHLCCRRLSHLSPAGTRRRKTSKSPDCPGSPGQPGQAKAEGEMALPQGITAEARPAADRAWLSARGCCRDDRLASRRSAPRLGGRASRLADGGCSGAAEVGETCVGTLSTDQAAVPKPSGRASRDTPDQKMKIAGDRNHRG